MRRSTPVVHPVVSVAMWPLIVIFSPLVLLAGEPVNRYVLRWAGRTARLAREAAARDGDWQARAVPIAPMPPRMSLLFLAVRNPLWIALTAPGRWVSDRFRRPSPRARRVVD